jgi:hypothetical protein
MTAVEAVRAARDAGVKITIDGNDLVLEAGQEPSAEVLNALKRHKAEILVLLSAHSDDWSVEDWRAFYDERVGIAEFDGGLLREDAEWQAFNHCVVEWLNRNPASSAPGHCAACGLSDRDGDAVVPYGIGGQGHAWLHPACWRGWYQDRKATAVTALVAMGIRVPAKFPKDFGKNGETTWVDLAQGGQQAAEDLPSSTAARST